MARIHTGQAIGKVSRLLADRLNSLTTLPVLIGRPSEASGGGARQLNLFLYEADFDASLRNVTLDTGQPPPLWLVLKYLLTAFDEGGHSNTADAHEVLGEGLRTLHALNYLKLPVPPPPTDIPQALDVNPEPLKITFDEGSADLTARLMQGTDEHYRFSVGFQVRPVLIVPPEPTSYNLLVGVDYTATPPELVGEAGVQIPVLPSLGPVIERVEPTTFEVEDTPENQKLVIYGNDLHLAGLSVELGGVQLPVTAQRPDRLECEVSGPIEGGEVLSPGQHGLAVVQTTATGRRRSSNLIVGTLRPTLRGATPSGLALSGTGHMTGTLTLEGLLLGTNADDALVALYRDGEVVCLLEMVDTDPPTMPPQTQRIATLADADGVPPGTYLVILRVGGAQAKQSPSLTLTP